jgi:hypothetical protein
MSQNPIAEWLTAFGTVGAVIASIYFATRDEVRRVRRERRQQAEHVTGWRGSGGGAESRPFFNVTVRNGSTQCVYRVIARLVQVYGGGTKSQPLGETKGDKHLTRIGLLPPGQDHSTTIGFAGNAAGLRFGVEFAFQDAAGRYWVRRANGALDEVKQDPLRLYGGFEPTDWENG